MSFFLNFRSGKRASTRTYVTGGTTSQFFFHPRKQDEFLHDSWTGIVVGSFVKIRTKKLRLACTRVHAFLFLFAIRVYSVQSCYIIMQCLINMPAKKTLICLKYNLTKRL